MEDETFARLLVRVGIQRAYHDGLGTHRVASDESCLATLRALGLPLDTKAEAAEALRELEQRRESCPLPPLVTGWENERIRIETVTRSAGAHLHVSGPGGLARRFPVDGDHTEAVGRQANGTVRRQVDLGELPLGRYELLLEDSSDAATKGRLVVAPRSGFARPERRFGVFMPLYSAWSEERPHASYCHLSELRQWVSTIGGAFLGTLPLFPTFLDGELFDPSPYSPITRRFFSELYLDLSRLPDHVGSVPSAVSRGEIVDYASWWSHQRPLLAEAANRFFDRGAHGLDEFLSRMPDTVDYARFRAATLNGGRPSDPSALPARRPLEPAEVRDPEIRFQLYCQMQVHEQLGVPQGSESGLYLDFPLGVHPSGYDAWRYRDRFAQGLGVGAPPDPLFSEGQSWGFAPLHPEQLFDREHEYIEGCLSRVMALSDVLRVDHVMGLHRVFCIPNGFEAADGIYLSQPSEKLYALFNLASHEHETELVGEDLGTVPDEVRHALAERSWRRMYVLPFHVRHDHVEPPPPESLACLNTHDMAPFAGHLEGRDLEVLVQLGFSLPGGNEHALEERKRSVDTMCETWRVDRQPEALLEAAIRFLASSDATLLLLSIEDLWLEPRSQNVPGTSSEYANWRGLSRHSIDSLTRLGSVQRLIALVRSLRS